MNFGKVENIKDPLKLGRVRVRVFGCHDNRDGDKYKIDENGRKYTHIIDTESGYPSRTNILSVSVVAKSCIIADAYATALQTMKVEDFSGFLSVHPELRVYIIFEDENKELAFKSFISSLTSSHTSPTCSIVSIWLVTLFCISPKCSGPIKSISSPKSSFIIVAPVNIERSSNVSFLLIPYTGASITFTFILPLTLFIAKADNTCWLTSAIISKDLLFLITCSKTFCIFQK